MSKLFKETLDKIKNNKKNFDEGKPNCIPFEWFPKLRKVLPGIIQGTNWLITASSGIGKTQFTKHTFVYKPIKWIKDNPKSGLKIKILYFALEESKQEFMMSMICNRLFDEYDIELDPLELLSMYEKSIPDDLISKIEECEEYFSDLEQYIDIVDSISNPTGIYKYIRQYSIENGTHYFYNYKTDKNKDNLVATNTLEDYLKMIKTKDWAYSHYVPYDPDEYVEAIVDHFSLLQPEEGANTLHLAMTKMSADYGRKMITKHFNYIFINVQQQAADTEKAEFTKMGGKIEEKFKPSLANLGDNKLTQRDCHVALGIFAPARYNIQKYEGYNILKLGDNFRSVEVLKNRIGSGYVEDMLFFDGRINEFKEYPDPDQMDSLGVYEIVKSKQKI